MSQLLFDVKPLRITELKPYRWITQKEQKEFVEFLEKAGLHAYLTDGKLSWCASEYEKYKCKNDESHVKVVKYLGCGKRGTCPRCSMGYAHKRAGIQYEFMKRNLADKLDFDLKINQIVLTLPKPLHSIDPKVFIKMVKSFMSKFGIEAYGYCIQNRHSENPLSDTYFHAHILSLNIKQDIDPLGVAQGLIQNDYFFDVDLMRQVWKSVIKEKTDYDVEGSVNLHTEYASILNDRDKVLHLLAYIYRYPIEDLFKVQVRNKTINYVQCQQIEKFCVSCYEHIPISDTSRLEHCRYLHHTIEDGWCETQPNNILQLDLAKKIDRLVCEPKPRLVWCGLLTSTKRKLLQSLIGVGQSLWQNLVDVEKDLDCKSKNCRDCGLPLEKEPYDRGLYQGDNEPI